MGRLSKESILTATDLPTEEVEVPEWGGSVLVRGMTGRERDEFEASMVGQRGGQEYRDYGNLRAKAVVKCVVGDDGERLFTDQDASALGEKSFAALERVYDVIARLSGLREADVQARERDFPGPTGTGSSSSSQNGLAAQSAVS